MAGQIAVTANMIASVWKVLVAVGDVITRESVLVVLEAMKMEISIRGPAAGQGLRVSAILKEPGERVQAGEALLLLSKVAD